jgi:hypothetical protein
MASAKNGMVYPVPPEAYFHPSFSLVNGHKSGQVLHLNKSKKAAPKAFSYSGAGKSETNNQSTRS